MKCPGRTLKEAPSEACAAKGVAEMARACETCMASADVGCASARPGRPRFLHMFSGPAGRSDGLASALRLLGCDCEDWDIENGDDFDLADDAAYRKLRSRVIQGEFDGGMLGPPCHTFSNARKEDDGGPRPLRLPGDRDIYGRSGLTPEEKEDVRLGTLLALRAADIFMCFYELDKPVILEQPLRPDNSDGISMLDLPEFKRLLALEGVRHVRLAQCNYGASSEKPTSLVHFKVGLADAVAECQHPKRWWRLPSSGAWKMAAHPPLKGKEAYIPADQWRPAMLLSEDAKGAKFRCAPYLTKAAASYPGGLNDYLAGKLNGAHSCVAPRTATWKLAGKWKNVLVRETSEEQTGGIDGRHGVAPKLTWAPSLRGHPGQTSPDDVEACLGGMRHPKKAMETIRGYDRMGKVVFKVLDRYLDSHPDLQQQCLEAIGSKDPNKVPSEDHVAAIVHELEDLFGLGERMRERGLDYGLLGAWGRKAGDPDAGYIETWLKGGSPAGIDAPIKDPGIFPQNDAEPESGDGVDYFHDPSGHENYKSVEDDPMALVEIQRLIDTGYVKTFDDLSACQEWLGGTPLTSKLAMVTKVRPDGTTTSGDSSWTVASPELTCWLRKAAECNCRDPRIWWMTPYFSSVELRAKRWKLWYWTSRIGFTPYHSSIRRDASSPPPFARKLVGLCVLLCSRHRLKAAKMRPSYAAVLPHTSPG